MWLMNQHNRSFNIYPPEVNPLALNVLEKLCSNSPLHGWKSHQYPTIGSFQVFKNAFFLEIYAKSADKFKIQETVCVIAELQSFPSKSQNLLQGYVELASAMIYHPTFNHQDMQHKIKARVQFCIPYGQGSNRPPLPGGGGGGGKGIKIMSDTCPEQGWMLKLQFDCT